MRRSELNPHSCDFIVTKLSLASLSMVFYNPMGVIIQRQDLLKDLPIQTCGNIRLCLRPPAFPTFRFDLGEITQDVDTGKLTKFWI